MVKGIRGTRIERDWRVKGGGRVYDLASVRWEGQ